MRRSILCLAALALTVAFSSSAQAQRRGPIFFAGVDPTQITNVPIDTSASVVPIAQPQTRSTGFRLIDLFPRISLPGAKPIFGQSQFPTQSQLPNADMLKAFGHQAPRAIGQ